VDLVVVLFDPAVALGGSVVVVEGDAGGDDVEEGGSCIAALISGTSCLPSPLKERATKLQPMVSATAHGSIGW
jgi:hypothetical protein